MTAPVATTPPDRSRERTPLPSELAGAFRDWLAANQVTDLDDPKSYYDYRGAFLAGINRDPVGGHFPDTFKQHGHPTFSVESKYSAGPYDGGTWVGEQFIPAQRGLLTAHAAARPDVTRVTGLLGTPVRPTPYPLQGD